MVKQAFLGDTQHFNIHFSKNIADLMFSITNREHLFFSLCIYVATHI